MRILFLSTFILLVRLVAYSQTNGVVMTDGANGTEPVIAANIFCIETQKGAVSNEKGEFTIETPNKLPYQLVFDATGYRNDTLIVTEKGSVWYKLNAQTLEDVSVVGERKATMLSSVTPLKTEILTEKEFHKAACCNLSESFTTNPSIDASVADAVTGKKEIQMLGLAGRYAQITVENLPLMRGLGKSNGLDYIPGHWVESIQISKGAGSVVNGYESMTGQINIEMLKPDMDNRFLANIYANHFGRMEANFCTKLKVSPTFKTNFLVHASGLPFKVEGNKDGFVDMPMYNTFSASNRWQYRLKNGFQGEFGVHGIWDDRRGGQTVYNFSQPAEQQNAYGYVSNTRQINFHTKNGWVNPEKSHQSVGLQVSGYYFDQNLQFGRRIYAGNEKQLSFNLIYQSRIASDKHTFKTGLSYMIDDYRQTFVSRPYNRFESVTGVFGEYAYKPNEKLTVVAGFRADYHNLYGVFLTPRVHARFNITEDLIGRVSCGRGYRVANVFQDYQSMFVSSRQIFIANNLKPEDAWNTGGSLVYNFHLFGRDGHVSADYFFTYFNNQIVADEDQSSTELHLTNLNGRSYSHAVQLETTFEPLKKLEIRLAYKWLDVRTTTASETRQAIFIAPHRVLVNLAYEYRNWMFDATMHWYSSARLPITSGSPIDYQRADRSPSYAIFNAQVTRKFRIWDVYVGVENIGGFKQNNPIVSANNPSGAYFDASMIWGPIMGQIFYAGFRLKIK